MRAYLTLLLSLAAVWGASFMFIEIALDDLEPTTLMAGRLLVASVVLVSLMAAQGDARAAAAGRVARLRARDHQQRRCRSR